MIQPTLAILLIIVGLLIIWWIRHSSNSALELTEHEEDMQIFIRIDKVIDELFSVDDIIGYLQLNSTISAENLQIITNYIGENDYTYRDYLPSMAALLDMFVACDIEELNDSQLALHIWFYFMGPD